MSLTQALSSALSGLQVNQAGIALVAANVANVDTPGYTRKVMDQVATGTSTSIGVRVSDIQREIDLYIQRQLRIENSGASYADTRARMYSQLQEIYGQPGSATSLEGVYNSFTTARCWKCCCCCRISAKRFRAMQSARWRKLEAPQCPHRIS